MKTRVICIEGIIGSGKTTQSINIANYLNSQNLEYIIIDEKMYQPYKTFILNWINEGANHNLYIDKIKEIADIRAVTHRNHFTSLLGVFDYLFFDRCLYTSGIYQATYEIDTEEIINLNLKAGVIKPQEGIVLICDPNIALRRMNTRIQKMDHTPTSTNRTNCRFLLVYETIDEITKRRERYIKLCRNHSELYLIDTTDKSEQEVFNEIKEKLRL